MALPTPVTKQHMDEAGDDPKLARAELADLVDKFNALLTHLGLSTITSGPLTVGQALEAASGALRVKLDGTTLARSAAGLRLNGPVSVANGGTGATDAAQARTNLGLGSLATKSSIATADIGNDQVTDAKLSHTGVNAGSYTNANITVNAQGRITSASNGSSGPAQASQAQMEAGSAGTVYVSPANFRHHRGACKGWAQVSWSGPAPQLDVGHNVASVQDEAVGRARVRWSVSLSSANYARVFGALGQGDRIVNEGDTTPEAGGVEIVQADNEGNLIDGRTAYVAVFGDF